MWAALMAALFVWLLLLDGRMGVSPMHLAKMEKSMGETPMR
jgi:hypothetical protein